MGAEYDNLRSGIHSHCIGQLLSFPSNECQAYFNFEPVLLYILKSIISPKIKGQVLYSGLSAFSRSHMCWCRPGRFCLIWGHCWSVRPGFWGNIGIGWEPQWAMNVLAISWQYPGQSRSTYIVQYHHTSFEMWLLQIEMCQKYKMHTGFWGLKKVK